MREFYNRDNSKPPSLGTVFINQLKYEPKLNRISRSCEGCGQIHSYHIHKKAIYPKLPLFEGVRLLSNTRHYISCPKCNFAMELDYGEYIALKKIADQNKEDGRG